MGYRGILDDRNFVGIEYLKTIFKKLSRFIRIGGKLVESQDGEIAKKTECFKQVFEDIDKAFDSLIGMDFMVDSLPCKMIYSYNKNEDLF